MLKPFHCALSIVLNEKTRSVSTAHKPDIISPSAGRREYITFDGPQVLCIQWGFVDNDDLTLKCLYYHSKVWGQQDLFNACTWSEIQWKH